MWNFGQFHFFIVFFEFSRKKEIKFKKISTYYHCTKGSLSGEPWDRPLSDIWWENLLFGGQGTKNYPLFFFFCYCHTAICFNFLQWHVSQTCLSCHVWRMTNVCFATSCASEVRRIRKLPASLRFSSRMSMYRTETQWDALTWRWRIIRFSSTDTVTTLADIVKCETSLFSMKLHFSFNF